MPAHRNTTFHVYTSTYTSERMPQPYVPGGLLCETGSTGYHRAVACFYLRCLIPQSPHPGSRQRRLKLFIRERITRLVLWMCLVVSDWSALAARHLPQLNFASVYSLDLMFQGLVTTATHLISTSVFRGNVLTATHLEQNRVSFANIMEVKGTHVRAGLMSPQYVW